MRVEIEVLAAPLVNYAMAHNGVAFLHRVIVAFPDATEPVEQVLVRGEVRDSLGTVLSRPWQEVREATPPSAQIAIVDPPLRLDAQQMSLIEEDGAGEIAVSVQVGGGDATVAYAPVRVPAANQWSVDPHSVLLSLELLAAFVQPNHPDLARLVAPIGDVLLRRTRSASLAVTDVAVERIDAIVEAAVTVLVDRGIGYAEPPPSWGYGQKVRGAGDVLANRVGTCLDTTLTLAGLLEHLGIGTTVWIAKGHAFLGYWRRSGLGLPDAASLQVTGAANAVDLGLLGVLETTLLTRERRPPKDLFRRVVQAPLDRYFRGGTADLVGVVDISTARMMRVLPLPARRERPDGVTEVFEYHASSISSPLHARPADRPADRPASPPAGVPVPPRVQAWKNSLLDLTLRNPLLNLGRGMTQLPLLMPHERLGAFADLLQDGGTISVRAADDLAWAVMGSQTRTAAFLPGDVQRSMLNERRTVFSELDGADHKRVMERLRYRARTGLQETGANLLSVTLGRLDWSLGDRQLSAPLLLAPVQLKGVFSPYRIALDPAGQITLNLSLVEKLRAEFGFTVPELRALPRRGDGDGVDVAAAVQVFREALAAAQLPFRVDGEARLAVVAFTGYLLWRDLDEHWQSFLERPLLRHLALTPTEPFDSSDVATADSDIDLDVIDLDVVTALAPIAADGSQAEAIAAARSRRSFVLEGPPGTGKSQTITNILADQMTHGRTVLFVAEKGAALDVVRARLEQAGLAPLTLDLHDDQARPNEVRRQLRVALALRPQPDTDAHRVAAQDVAACATGLRDYARRLHEPNAAGLSLYGARGLQLARGHGPALAVPAQAPGVREAVTASVPHLAMLGENTWRTWGFAHRLPGDLPGWWSVVDRADASVTRAAQLVEAGPGGPVKTAHALAGASTITELGAVVWLLGGGAANGAVLREVSGRRWQDARVELTARMADMERSAMPVLAVLTPAVVLMAPDQLTEVRQRLREAAASFFFGRKRRLLAAAAPLLAHLRPGADIPAKQLTSLAEQVALLAEQNAAVVAGWRALPGCAAVLPPNVNPLDEQGRALILATAAALERDSALFASLRPELGAAVEQARAWEPPLGTGVQTALDDATNALREVLAGCGAREQDQRRWADGPGLLQQWSGTASTRAADRPAGSGLRRWADLIAELAPLEGSAEQARWQLLTQEVSAIQATAALERGLAEASVAERIDSQGFGDFRADQHDHTVNRFVEASATLRTTLRGVLPDAVVARRPFATGRLFGTVAALEREVHRSRGGLSVRRLIEQYGPVIAEVTPCLLVSPDSLARFVAPGAISFDLVVFDEASQITVADAVGALGRAQAAVVAGDSKQMPPTSFAQLGSGEDGPEQGGSVEDFQVVPDEESILSEAVMASLPRLWLSWHYRSQDESLIAFSNAQYYEGRLLTFPSVPGRELDAGVSFTRVPGRFLRTVNSGEGLLRTNPVEAAAVVEEVLRRWLAGERSIGVVTFNVQQRGLIESMLIDSGQPGIAESLDARRDGLFVKNLENVQGDERDVVLFSTGFSAAANGVLPLNFGPLNRVGGERRLNVAITRARRRVMVFSSFDPQDLRAEQTSSVGIKHLRAYLELVEDGPGAGALPRPGVAEATVDRHRDEIADCLRGRGLDVRTAVGLSEFQVDLAVGAPGAPAGAPPVLAVLLDSPPWARRRTTADRDGLAAGVLEQSMNWPATARVWLPRWISDPGAVLDELVDLARRGGQAPVRRSGLTVVRTSTTVLAGAGENDDRPPDGVASAAEPYVAFEPEPSGTARHLDALAAGRAVPDVDKLIRRIVETEGPVSSARLARLVARCHGISRLQPARQLEIVRVVPDDLYRDGEGFIWPTNRDPLRWKGYRTFDGPVKDRPLDDVCLAEIANALVDLTRSAMGISTEDLLREVTRSFGGTRVTEAGRTRLSAGLDLAVRGERLRVSAGVVRAG